MVIVVLGSYGPKFHQEVNLGWRLDWTQASASLVKHEKWGEF